MKLDTGNKHMTQYKALQDVPPGVTKGDLVEFLEPLDPSLSHLYKEFDAEEETIAQTAGDNTDPVMQIINPSRSKLKAKATELGLNFADNISTIRLSELIAGAEAKRQSGDGSENPGDPSDAQDDDPGEVK